MSVHAGTSNPVFSGDVLEGPSHFSNPMVPYSYLIHIGSVINKVSHSNLKTNFRGQVFATVVGGA